MSAELTLVDSEAGELVSPASRPTRARRRADIELLDAAVGALKQSTVEIADVIVVCRNDEAHEEDESFKDAVVRGAIDLSASNRWVFGAWIEFRYGFRPTYAKQLLQAGELRAILTSEGAAAYAAAELPAIETGYRPMAKALNPSYLEVFDEVEDDDDRDKAIRRIYRAALKLANGDPVKAAKEFPRAARRDGFEPIARRFKGRTPAEQKTLKAARLERFRSAGIALVRSGRHADVRRVCEELLGMLK